MVAGADGKFTIKEIMNPNVVSLGPNAPLLDASKLTELQKIGSVVVENNNPVGIITERDFPTRIVLKPFSANTKISEVMCSPIIHVSSDQSIADIIDIMVNMDIRKVPVIDDGKVLGIVTGTEFLRLFVHASDEDMQKTYQQYVKRVYSKWFDE